MSGALTVDEREHVAGLILRNCSHEGRNGKTWCCADCHDLRQRVLYPALAAHASMTIPWPRVPFGPHGVHPDRATADYYAEARRRIVERRLFGSNLTESVADVLRHCEAALRLRADRETRP